VDDDNPTSEEMQRYEERRMLDLFLEYADIPVIASSIESRSPPEPDILCRLENGEVVAFELAELSDQNAQRGWNTMMQFRTLLNRIFNDLPPAVRSELGGLYRMCRIDVTFDPDVSLRRHATAISALYSWLAKQPRFIGNLDANALPQNVASAIPSVRISEPAPDLWIEPAFSMQVREPDLSVFEKKLNSKYETSHPIELLLHSTGILSDRWIDHYSGFLCERIANSSFRRVWVFSPSERASEAVHPLRFVYPARN
jgi:hypothetical protein